MTCFYHKEGHFKAFYVLMQLVLVVLWLEGTGIQFLKHYMLIQISYCINLIPGNCVIAKLLTTCRHSDFWQNIHVFSFFTLLVTVSKGST